GAPTVNTAAAVDTTVFGLPRMLVKTARYWLPLSDEATASVNVVEAAPAMSTNVLVPLSFTCHWIDTPGLATAPAVKIAAPPANTPWLMGWSVTAGTALGA